MKIIRQVRTKGKPLFIRFDGEEKPATIELLQGAGIVARAEFPLNGEYAHSLELLDWNKKLIYKRVILLHRKSVCDSFNGCWKLEAVAVAT